MLDKKSRMSAISLLILALFTSPSAADPLGHIVNKFMEYVIDGDQGNERQRSAIPVPMRNIPKDSATGYLSSAIKGNRILIDGREYTLAFNSRIRDEYNRIVQTGMIREEKKVRYTFDADGRINRIWLLAPGERSESGDFDSDS